MLIKKAVIKDIKPIHKILNQYADQDLLLPRSLSELYDHLRDYFVVEGNDHRHPILGVCGLRIFWEDLAEVKSLAVSQGQQGKGLGSGLVKMCLKEAKHLGLNRVFALTYVPDFFATLGFRIIDKSVLPQKIWADCLHCPKFPNCNELAVIIDL
ncbi:MAG TPA: N-acetyltransferase [Desulfobacteraceae bacterium]|nr:N-acetyltransferase [Desulfobacteraceae bacterium]